MNLRSVYLAAILVVITLGVYYPSISAPFNSLDDHLLVTHLINKNYFSLSEHFFPGGTSEYYRPLSTLSFELDKYLWGLVESFMHLENILLHVINVLLVFFIARNLSGREGPAARVVPFLAAGCFALHPINTEAVNWISARTDLLAGSFAYAALLLLLIALKRQQLIWGGLGAVVLFLGCLSKETALFLLPGVFFLLMLRNDSWGFCPRIPKRSFRLALLFVYGIAPLGYFCLRWIALHRDRGIQNTVKLVTEAVTAPQAASAQPSGSSWGRLMQAVDAAGFYCKKMFLPFPLNFGIATVDSRYFFLGILLFVLVVWLVWRRTPVSALLLTSIALGSSALLVVVTALGWVPIAERYMYVVTGPFAIAMTFFIADLIKTLQAKRVVAFLVVFFFAGSAYATVTRNMIWQSNLALFEDTVRKSPDFPTVENELAMALIENNRKAEAMEILESIQVPSSQASSLNRMTVYYERGEYQLARQFLQERLEKGGAYEITILEFLIRISYDMINRSDDNERKREILLEIQSWLTRLEEVTHNSFVWYRLGRVALSLGDKKQAKGSFKEAARRLPKDSLYKAPAKKLAETL
jgi:tetratricopeptide (TPR) repeat protein